MTQRGDEANVGLASPREVENRQILLILDREEKLFQTVAGSGLWLCPGNSAPILWIQHRGTRFRSPAVF